MMAFLAAKAKREIGWLSKFSQSGQRTQIDMPGAEGEAFFPASSLQISILLGSIVHVCRVTERHLRVMQSGCSVMAQGKGRKSARGTWDLGQPDRVATPADPPLSCPRSTFMVTAILISMWRPSGGGGGRP